MSKRILFVTNNAEKFEEVKRWLYSIDSSITLEQAAIDLPEHQSLDVQIIAREKALDAWRLLQEPLLIDDGGLYIEKYYNFPGPLAKYVFQGIGLEGTWLLAHQDPRAYFLTCLVYVFAPETYVLFEGQCKGRLIEPPNKISKSSLPYSTMFIPQGSTQTLFQLKETEEEKIYHHRYKALKNFISWLKEK